MAVKVKCPWCRALVEMEGDRTVCPKCGHEITLARAAAMDPLPPPPAKEETPFPREKEGLKLTIAFILFALVACIFLVRIHTVPPGRPIVNEAAAISTLRTIYKAQEGYRQRWGSYASLGKLQDTGAVDVKFRRESTARLRSGYCFTFRVYSDRWNATAVPAGPGKTGKRSFYIDQTGTIRSLPYESDSDSPADANSPPLGQ